MVRVDFSDADRKWREEYERIRTLPFRALRAGKNAARLERRSSTYQNRTGQLRGGTEAQLNGGHLGFTVYVMQGAFYGVFVQARGFSDFTDIGDDAMAAMGAIVTGSAGG
jgi:hypothetical protein